MPFGNSAINRALGGMSPQQQQGGIQGKIGGRSGSGLGGAVMGQNSPQVVSPGGGTPPPPMPGPAAAPAPPTPGVTGITPGAIERRVDPGTPSLGLSGGMPPTPPSMAFGNRELLQHKPNLAGPARTEMSAPVGNIQQFLQNLRNNRGPQ